MVVDRSGMEHLDRDTCVQLLRQAEIGRVGLCPGEPVILPVRFQVLGDRILFRTGRGTKLAAASSNTLVAFEADHVDPTDRTGWSVLVVGHAHDVSDEDRTPHERFLLSRWAPGDEDRIVAVDMERVTGRRLTADAVPHLGAPRRGGG
jgi:nitroimidazol reductase NimA-like FMN-containing flavoprotein (pyridoxamine 5'-phosphate oxidase superfamily)